ncbi:MAG TPA: MBL fold metallo-hydrolase [Planctomycetes bacterium]|nr:MBL fold metallo-hydrolase [Planctomycetota bacterium]
MKDRLYFRQLLSGRDFAHGDPVAAGMVNFVYLIGDRQTKTCLVVDPAYAVQELLDLAAQDEMEIEGVLATHFHPDHIGGDLMGHSVQGVQELLELRPVQVHAQRIEAPWIQEMTGISKTDMSLHDSGDLIHVGEIPIRLIHTPGHTPGSQCFLVEGNLVAGDTLFLQGCGRTDLPGGNSKDLYHSIHDKLAKLPDETVIFPGHLYSEAPSATLQETKSLNYVFKPKTEEEWLRLFSG